MKRVCVLVVALFVLGMAVPAMATLTRVSTMGNQFLYIQDDYNIWNFTSTVNNYPRHLVVDHNGAYRNYTNPFTGGSFNGSSRVGMIVPFMSTSVLGAFISDGSVALSSLGMAINTDQRLDLIYGYRASSWDLGLRLEWWGDGAEADGKQTSSAVGLQAGVGINTNSGMFDINAFYRSLSYTFESLFGTPVTTVSEKDKGNWAGFSARYVYAYNNMVSLVPALSYETFTLAEKTLGTAGAPPAAGNGNEFKASAFDLGVGCNTVPLQGTEFLTSIGYRTTTHEWKDTSSVTPPPAFFEDMSESAFYLKFGGDIQVKNWLFFRVGAEKNIVATAEDKSIDPVVKNKNADFAYELGAGIMVGDVQFDVSLNKDWLNAGPYFLSGSDEGWMFPYISFKYDFR